MDKPPDLSFLDLEAPVLREWAALPVSRLLVRHLVDLRMAHLEEAAQAALRGVHHRASAYAGVANIINVLISDISDDRTKAEAPTQDSTFVDPARRRNANV